MKIPSTKLMYIMHKAPYPTHAYAIHKYYCKHLDVHQTSVLFLFNIYM